MYVYPELREVCKNSLPSCQLLPFKDWETFVDFLVEAVLSRNNTAVFQVQQAVPKKGDTLPETNSCQPGCARPQKGNNHLPTLHLQVLLLLVSQRVVGPHFYDFQLSLCRISGVLQKPRCFCHAPKGCHTQLMGQGCPLHPRLSSCLGLRLSGGVEGPRESRVGD